MPVQIDFGLMKILLAGIEAGLLTVLRQGFQYPKPRNLKGAIAEICIPYVDGPSDLGFN